MFQNVKPIISPAMILREITCYLESMAPPSLQESYDNSGLLVGSYEMDISAALICLDCTPEVVDEAIRKGCNLIIAHHPIVFSGLKRINGKNYIERVVINAIRNNIAISAIHTNLDNIHQGVNHKIAEKLGLSNTRVLLPKKGQLNKLVVFVPTEHLDKVKESIFSAGAGHIGNYDQCSFATNGTGTFRASEDANPFVGTLGTQHTENEVRLEFVVPKWLLSQVVNAIKSVHPYEEIAIDIYPIENEHNNVGSGLIGSLESELDVVDFLRLIKKQMNALGIRFTQPHKQKIQTVAVCGGSGSFLLNDAIKAGADIFVTADFKYHQFFDADNRIIIADIGHYESEQFTIELISDWLAKKFATFATHLTETVTNPVRYL